LCKSSFYFVVVVLLGIIFSILSALKKPQTYYLLNFILYLQIGGLSTRMKQIIGYEFTTPKLKGRELGPACKEAVVLTNSTGLHCIGVTSDMGSSNVGAWD
jgi:hypothetical protein